MHEWQSRGFRFHISIFFENCWPLGSLGQNACNFVEPDLLIIADAWIRSLPAWEKEAFFRPRLVWLVKGSQDFHWKFSGFFTGLPEKKHGHGHGDL